MRWLRYFFTTVSVFSVLLWVLSHLFHFTLQVPYGNTGGGVFTDLALGKALVTIQTSAPPKFAATSHTSISKLPPRGTFERQYLAGFMKADSTWPLIFYDYESNNLYPGRTWTFRFIMFPLWLPSILFSIWPAISLILHIKRRYFSPEICRKCGYDLRGSPSGVCPECGRAPSKEKTPAEAEV